jgi:hypothetical protein
VLETGRVFPLASDVFSLGQIESDIGPKRREVYRFGHAPHSVEFEMYHSV